jgi:hypothetical protein
MTTMCLYCGTAELDPQGDAGAALVAELLTPTTRVAIVAITPARSSHDADNLATRPASATRPPYGRAPVTATLQTPP